MFERESFTARLGLASVIMVRLTWVRVHPLPFTGLITSLVMEVYEAARPAVSRSPPRDAHERTRVAKTTHDR
jgi:hypothetical protein